MDNGRSQSHEDERQALLQSTLVASSRSESPKSSRSDGKSSPSQERNVVKLLSAMFCFFAFGVMGTGIGALLPEIEGFYDLSDGVTAIIFPSTVAGYLTGACLLERIHVNFGRRGVALVAPVTHILQAAILVTAPSFTIVLVAYFIGGVGNGLVDCGWNAWASKLPRANTAQGFLHGSYGLGSVVGPYITIPMFNNGLQWSKFYYVAGVLSIIELVTLGWAFYHDDASQYRALLEVQNDEDMGSVFWLLAPWMCGLYFLIDVGIETSLTDWIVTFMRRERDAPPTIASLASSIFWMGMTLGRFTLGPVTQRFGLSASVSTYIVCAIVLQVLFRLFTDTATSLILAGAIGYFLGPMFPSGVVLLAGKVSSGAVVRAVAMAAALGQIGAASIPLVIGIVADRLGIGQLFSIDLVLSILLLLVWCAFVKLVQARVTVVSPDT